MSGNRSLIPGPVNSVFFIAPYFSVFRENSRDELTIFFDFILTK